MKKFLLFIFSFFSVLTFTQEEFDSVQLDQMIFDNKDKLRSIEILETVEDRLKENYAFHDGVNYPIEMIYKSGSCNNIIPIEMNYKGVLNSSIKIDTADLKCMTANKEDHLVMSFLFLANIKWLNNWTPMFSVKRLEKAKYGELEENSIQKIITTYGKEDGLANWFVNNNYAITAIKAELSQLTDSFAKIPCKNGTLELNYHYLNGKHHPKNVSLKCEGKQIELSYGQPTESKKLKRKENSYGLLELAKILKVEDENDKKSKKSKRKKRNID